MLGVNYGPEDDPLAVLKQRSKGAISVYARGDDYHDVIKRNLKALARWLVATAACEVKGDSNNIERSRARRYGRA